MPLGRLNKAFRAHSIYQMLLKFSRPAPCRIRKWVNLLVICPPRFCTMMYYPNPAVLSVPRALKLCEHDNRFICPYLQNFSTGGVISSHQYVFKILSSSFTLFELSNCLSQASGGLKRAALTYQLDYNLSHFVWNGPNCGILFRSSSFLCMIHIEAFESVATVINFVRLFDLAITLRCSLKAALHVWFQLDLVHVKKTGIHLHCSGSQASRTQLLTTDQYYRWPICKNIFWFAARHMLYSSLRSSFCGFYSRRTLHRIIRS